MARILEPARITGDDRRRAAAALAAGELLCLPTDTVYGIACLPGSRRGRERIYRLKGRAPGKPLALVFTDLDQLRERLPSLPPKVAAVLPRLLPGPVTAVLPVAGGDAAELGAAGAATLGVRVVPPALADCYQGLPLPLALTSANRSGEPEPVSLDSVAPAILDACHLAVDAGPCEVGRPSTVVDLSPLAAGGPPAVLREGALGEDELSSLLAAGSPRERGETA